MTRKTSKRFGIPKFFRDSRQIAKTRVWTITAQIQIRDISVCMCLELGSKKQTQQHRAIPYSAKCNPMIINTNVGNAAPAPNGVHAGIREQTYPNVKLLRRCILKMCCPTTPNSLLLMSKHAPPKKTPMDPSCQPRKLLLGILLVLLVLQISHTNSGLHILWAPMDHNNQLCARLLQHIPPSRYLSLVWVEVWPIPSPHMPCIVHATLNSTCHSHNAPFDATKCHHNQPI